MAVISLAGVSMRGQCGQFRASAEQLGWRGAEGSKVTCSMKAIVKVEWHDGSFRMLYTDQAGVQQLLPLDGFEEASYEPLRRHFLEHAGLNIVNHSTMDGDLAVKRAEVVRSATSETHTFKSAPLRALDVRLGQWVRCRNGEGVWKCGVVTSLTPVLVKPEGGSEGAAWDEVSEENLQRHPLGLMDSTGRVIPLATETPKPLPTLLQSTQGLDKKCPAPTSDDKTEEAGETAKPFVAAGVAASNLTLSEKRYSNSLMEGWVAKRSRFLMEWRRRYLVLTADTLSFYRDAGDSEPSETIDVALGLQVVTGLETEYYSQGKADLAIGQLVRVRNHVWDAAAWKSGMVMSIVPLKVMVDGSEEHLGYDKVVDKNDDRRTLCISAGIRHIYFVVESKEAEGAWSHAIEKAAKHRRR